MVETARPAVAAGIAEDAADGLVISGVGKAFPGVQALSEVDFRAVPGEVHGLVGENGAGKSTLMAIASGALSPDTGELWIRGQAVERADPERVRDLGLAIVRQEPALMPDLTVAENLFLGVSKAHRPSPGRMRSWARRRLAEWDEDIALDPGAKVSTLVPEEKFIVEISKVLAQRPSVLVLDEPTEHLSAGDVHRLFTHIRRLRASGCAVVYISHRINEVREIADRITVLRDGRVRGTSDAADLDEGQIVNLIAGRTLESAFPAKPADLAGRPVVLTVDGLGGPGFSDVSLSVRRGEIIGLAGIEGNGQREFLRALAGLNRARGSVGLGGGAVSLGAPARARAAGVGYVPADRHREGIAPALTVRENVTLRTLGRHTRLGFLRRPRERAAAERAVAAFRIRTPDTETPVAWLSGGNQQKVVLASVLEAGPRLLLADEPTQGVDVGARAEIYDLLREVAAAGTAVVLVSSDLKEIAGLCDRVITFSRGTAIAEHAGPDVTEENITRSVITATSERARRRAAHGAVAWLAGGTAPVATVAAVILALGVYASVINDFYLTTRGIGGILALAAVLALVACGQQFVMAVGGVDLSVGPLMGTLVVIESFYLIDDAVPATLAMGWFLLVAVPVAVGVLNWLLVDVVRLEPMVATLATYIALQGVSLTLRPTPGGLISGGLTDTVSTRFGAVPLTFLAAVAVAVLAELVLFRTAFGIALRGVGSHAESARVAGLEPKRIRLMAYVGCSLFAALAAVALMAQVGSGDPNSGTSYTLSAIAAVVIGGASIFGGRGSFVGALLGALLIAQVGAVTTFLRLSEAWNLYLLGGMILAAVAAYSKSRELALPR
ncbi:ATP-binding cassette domain-containing protein [Actinomadura sp. B10D3]|uniref:ATP-binding cassette domain-containing protein n=1 Tax=Actinomadura sp. B10D3 TaxID=3153557 RepID=UPI00325D0FB2